MFSVRVFCVIRKVVYHIQNLAKQSRTTNSDHDRFKHLTPNSSTLNITRT